ncbi:MAG: hypothetical protein HN341_04490 [Verrucomicrobia bacterium]|jgi:hypothetical protein|nr:hypothetical protein [Verrucomicrobiota bacterium]
MPIDIETIEACVEKLHDTFDRTDLDIEWTKIKQKAKEARYNPGDVRPLADCILSILLAARSEGHKAGTVLDALSRMSAMNIEKEWKKMPDGTYQAI